eukprot:SAG11_NODE_5163_length_1642_cov_3.873623_1_plen_324_part_00
MKASPPAPGKGKGIKTPKPFHSKCNTCGSPFPKERCTKHRNAWKQRCERCQKSRDEQKSEGRGERDPGDLRHTIDLARARNPKSPSPADPNNDHLERESLHTVTVQEDQDQNEHLIAGNVESYDAWAPAVAAGNRPLAQGGPKSQPPAQGHKRPKQTARLGPEGKRVPGAPARPDTGKQRKARQKKRTRAIEDDQASFQDGEEKWDRYIPQDSEEDERQNKAAGRTAAGPDPGAARPSRRRSRAFGAGSAAALPTADTQAEQNTDDNGTANFEQKLKYSTSTTNTTGSAGTNRKRRAEWANAVEENTNWLNRLEEQGVMYDTE